MGAKVQMAVDKRMRRVFVMRVATVLTPKVEDRAGGICGL